MVLRSGFGPRDVPAAEVKAGLNHDVGSPCEFLFEKFVLSDVSFKSVL